MVCIRSGPGGFRKMRISTDTDSQLKTVIRSIGDFDMKIIWDGILLIYFQNKSIDSDEGKVFVIKEFNQEIV